MSEVFTLRRSYFRLGLILLPFYLALLLIGVSSIYFDGPSGRGVYAALFAGALWSFMVGASLYILLCYFKESVTLYKDSVYITHVLGARAIALGEVLHACWYWRRQSPFLKLVLRDGKEVLRFNDYPPRQCRRLIACLRERLPLQIQQGWSEAMGLYPRGMEGAQSKEELNRFIGSLWRPALAGPIGGFCCGLALHLCEVYFDVAAIPKWSGSLMVDWTGIGILIGLLVWAGMWMLRSVFGPDE